MVNTNKMPDSMKRMISLVIGIATIAMIILILFVIINNIPTDSIPTDSFSSNQSILTNNNSIQTISPIGDGIVSLSATIKNQSWIDLDGIDDAIAIENTAGAIYNNSNTNMTIMMWIKKEGNHSVPQYVFSHNATSGAGNSIYISFPANKSKLTFTVGSVTTESVNNSLVGEWNHIALSFAFNESYTGYLNGANITLDIKYNGSTGLEDMLVGALNVSGTYPYNGSIDELRIFTRNMSQLEIQEIYTSGRSANSSINRTNLATWYKLNERTGTVAYDFSLNKTNGTISGATWNNDDIDVTLTQDTDYTLVGENFTITNSELAWTGINTIWGYTSSESRNDLDSIKGNYSQSLLNTSVRFPTIGTIIGIAVLLLILIALLVFVIMKMMGVAGSNVIGTSSGNNFRGNSSGFS